MAKEIDNIDKGKEATGQAQDGWKRRIFGSLFSDSEKEEMEQEEKSFKEMWKEASIDSRWFLRQVPFLLFIVLGLVGLVTLHYTAQNQTLEKDKLEGEIEKARYAAINQASAVTEQTRQSKIEQTLKTMGDSTLVPAKEPPYTIKEE